MLSRRSFVKFLASIPAALALPKGESLDDVTWDDIGPGSTVDSAFLIEDIDEEITIGWDHYAAVQKTQTTQMWYNGKEISHVAYWSEELSKEEIELLSKGASPLIVNPEHLIAYWPLYGG